MARKGWNALSPQYKARLQKAGITEADYASGQSISKARGHLHTPERPSAANPVRHATYVAERDRLINRLVRLKNDFFGTSPKWNPTAAARPFKDKPPAIARLRHWVTLSRQDWIDAIRTDGDSVAYLGYH